MRHLLTLVSLLLVGSVWADDFNFNSPRAKAAMEKYQYDKKDLLRDLEAALEHERTKGSLEEAIKIRDAIATLKQQPDAPVANAQIPADAVEWNGHFYKVIPLRGTHQAALNYCAENGGHLARIESKNEQGFIERLLSGSNENYWVDGSDAAREGRWMFSDGTPMSYLNFHPGEPNNSQGIENFIAANAPHYTWNDTTAASSNPFICEWDGLAGRTQRAKKIPADAVKYKGNYYKAYNEGMPHSVAQKRCEMMGGHLARITNQAEHNFIDRTLDQQIKTPIKQQTPSERDHWVDGERGADGVWRFSDGTKLSYFNWDGNPVIPFVDTNRRWLALGFPESNHGWMNFSGDHRLGFICEWEGGDKATQTANDILETGDIIGLFLPGEGYWQRIGRSHGSPIELDNRNKGNDHQRFQVTKLDNGKIALRASNDKYVSRIDRGHQPLEAAKSSIDPFCQFEVVPMGRGRIALKADNGQYVSYILRGVRAIEAGKREIDIYSIFNIQHFEIGKSKHSKSAPQTPTKPERTKPKPEEPIKKLSPKHAKRVLDDANLWEGKPGIWFLKRANNFSGRTYERLSQSNRIRSALASVNGRLPTPDEMKSPPSRR